MPDILDTLIAQIEELNDEQTINPSSESYRNIRYGFDKELVEIVRCISNFPARSVDELKLKARAAEIVMRVDPVGGTEGAYLTIAQSIVQDLWAFDPSYADLRDNAVA